MMDDDDKDNNSEFCLLLLLLLRVVFLLPLCAVLCCADLAGVTIIIRWRGSDLRQQHYGGKPPTYSDDFRLETTLQPTITNNRNST